MSRKATPRRGRSATVGALAYQLKTSLHQIAPPIWRRVLVSSDDTFARLHEVIQAAFGWEGCHLYEFRVADTTIGVRERQGSDIYQPELEASRTKLLDFIEKKGARCLYVYDFGDDWYHEIVLEGTRPKTPDVITPLLVAGARACPPEDCGGPPGYEELLEALRDPKHERHEELVEWLGGDYDAEAFDIEAARAEVGRVGRGRAKRKAEPDARGPSRRPG